MAIRVIQWATGGVGRAAVAGVVAHPDLELVGCWVHSPDKVGVDVGELCGLGPLGVAATDDVDALPRPGRRLRRLLPDHGRPDGGGAHPGIGRQRGHPARLVLPRRARRVRHRGGVRRGGTSVHGTGIHPGASPSSSR